MKDEIVITAAGLATCLGLDRGAVWEAVKAGKCGIAPFTAMEQEAPTDGGQAMDLPVDVEKELRREVRYLRYVLRDVFGQLGSALPPPNRRGIVLGTTLHGIGAAGQFLRSGNSQALREFPAAAVMKGAIADFGIDGPALTTCSACSSSLGAIALAVTLLRRGLVDLVIAGGYDPVSEYVYAGFNSLRLLSRGLLRPFARDRTGMKVGEGYGLMVLERSVDAHRRGARPLAAIAGFGESADSHHLTQPHPNGDGAARAIETALRSSELTAGGIDMIAAHGTGTPDNDAGESAALARIWEGDLPRVPVVAFKSHLSHTLGAAGAVELILSATALERQTVPPCANVTAADCDFAGVRLASDSAREQPIGATLNLSLGFGGANTCMILTRPRDAAPSGGEMARRQVCITGIGVVLPQAVGNAAFVDLLKRSEAPVSRDMPEIPETALAELLSARRIRRMSGYVKYSLAAATLALRDARADAAFCQSASVILGTAHGSSNFCYDYYRQVVDQGIAAANPMLFAEGVPNAAAAHLSLATGIKGGCQTIVGSRTAGLDALGLAAMRIADGTWDRAVVGAAEEYCPTQNLAYACCGLYAPSEPSEPFSGPGKFVAGCGAVAMVLESAESAANRGAAVIARMNDYRAAARPAALALGELGEKLPVMTSANGTWIDRVEEIVMRESGSPRYCTLGRRIAETFSAGPLAAVAAVLLTGEFPGQVGAVRNFAALATDYSGSQAAVSISL